MGQARWVGSRGSGLVLALLACGAVGAQEVEPTPGEPQPGAEQFRRRPASAAYVDPESRFSLQGYVTGTWGDFQEDFAALDFAAPGQLLVPRTANSSFQYDWALFLGSRLSESVRFVVETHFVPRADLDFHPDIVTTEANVTWMPLADRHALRLSLGEYWAPFTSVNDDWLSAVNAFSTVPLAARAAPLHYNERGLLVEGEFGLGGARGLNYAFSVGNGVDSLGLDGQRGFDATPGKTVLGRLGFLPRGSRLEIAVSGMRGRLPGSAGGEPPSDVVQREPAVFRAAGLEARYRRPGLDLQTYGIRSTEDLERAPDLDRWGVVVEAEVRVARGLPALRDAWIKLRWDRSRLDTPLGTRTDDQVLSLGVNFHPAPRMILKTDVFLHEEKAGPALRDNGVSVQATASF